jgi:group II intron reverse transcriptase/maturase
MVRTESRQRKQKTSQEGYPQKAAVNTLWSEEGLSLRPTQINETIIEERHNHLMEKVVERKNLIDALKRVRQNKGAPGIDGMKVEELLPYLNKHWSTIKEELLLGTYSPKPVRRSEIQKPDGGVRLLGIPTVLDRFIQQAVQQVLTPIYDPMFSQNSYGFRPERGAKMAVNKAREYLKDGNEFVVDTDLEKFFDRVNHDILIGLIAKRIEDKRIIKLIRKYLQAGVMINGCCIASEKGTPQGGPISPLLSNIMLDVLDKELERRGHKFVRYADDCNIYVRSRRAGTRVMESVKNFLNKKLKLMVNEKKSAVDLATRRKILGFSFVSGEQIKVRLAEQTIEKLKNKIRELTRRSNGQSMDQRLEKLNAYLKGWMGYFSLAETPSVFNRIDGWIRRRLRMCLWKQWKTWKSRLRNLRRLEIKRSSATDIALSSKGCWRIALTPQMHRALGLAYWQEQGLVSLFKRYEELRSVV